jgi:hypothetical protein
MAAKKIGIQCIQIEDRPGSLQKFLSRAAKSGVDFVCFTAFSTGTGAGRVYLSAKDTGALKGFLQKAGLESEAAAGFIVSGADKVGAGADALKGLADAGINGLAGAAMVCGEQFQMLVVVDSADAEAAQKALSG